MWFKKRKNLFNKNSVVHGALKEDGTIDLMDGYYYTSDFIPVISGETYFKGQTESSRFKFYYKDKTQYSNTYLDLANASAALSFSIPKNVCYIRFTVTQDFLENLQVEQGSVATEYEEYGKDKIFVKNDNDIYEEFRKNEKIHLIPITPLAGNNYEGYDNCFYYKKNTRIHVHLGLKDLTQNTNNTIFTMPERT